MTSTAIIVVLILASAVVVGGGPLAERKYKRETTRYDEKGDVNCDHKSNRNLPQCRVCQGKTGDALVECRRFKCNCSYRTGEDLTQCLGYNNVTGTVRWQNKAMLNWERAHAMLMNATACKTICFPRLTRPDPLSWFCDDVHHCAYYNRDTYNRQCLFIGKHPNATWATCTSAGEGSPLAWTHPPMCVFIADAVAYKFM